jgi:hypothetical protein
MRRGGEGGGEIKRNAKMGSGENSKERNGSIRKRGVRRGGGGQVKRNAEMGSRENSKEDRGVLAKEE